LCVKDGSSRQMMRLRGKAQSQSEVMPALKWLLGLVDDRLVQVEIVATLRMCELLGRKSRRRAPLQSGAIAGDAVARFSLRMARWMLTQTSPVSAVGWNDGEMKRKAREHHASMFWVHRATLRRRGEDGSAGTRCPRRTPHHGAMVLAAPPAACGQVRLGIGRCSMHKRHSVQRANQRKQQHGDPAAHGGDSLNERARRSQ
jgi:hypothetical protein